MHGIPLNSVSNSLSYDVVRFKIEVGVEEKFMYKNVHNTGNTAIATACWLWRSPYVACVVYTAPPS